MNLRPYSRVLARRASAIGLASLALLALATGWQQRQPAPSGDTVFRPAQRIEQILAVGSAMQEPLAEAASRARQDTPCQERPAQVLRGRVMDSLQIDAAQAQNRLRAAARASGIADCAGFTQAVRQALSLGSGEGSAGWSPARVAQGLVEDVTWTRRIPCLLARDRATTLVLAGPAGRCAVAGSLGSLGTRPAEASFRRQAGIVAAAATAAGASGRLPATESIWLTLDARLQDHLDRLQPCRRAPGCTQWSELAGLSDVSLVVMDAASGAVLAAWCDGPACERAARGGGGGLPAALMEAPPASTAKLLFSLSLAQLKRVDPLLLQRQIKTSGQMDNQVTKRNEWWEKQAICDDQPASSCQVPARALQIAQALGWNAHCQRPGPRCGRWGLISAQAPDLSAALVGRLALPAAPDGGARMLDWARYEQVRSARRSAQGLAGYDNTSRAVQAVLGAGDSRTSALGLAMLPMQLWRLAQGQPPLRAQLVQPQADTQLPGAVPLDLQPAAQVVLAGMRKVIEPAEAGWQGAGTVAPAFARVMGRPCTGSCGLWAKTGTVSAKDTGFGGTTVLSALVDTRELAQWLGAAPSSAAPGRILSIGVIARGASGEVKSHAASQIGMGLVRHVILPWSQP